MMFGDLNLDGITSEGAWVLFTRGDESPTLPVSREEWLRLQIFEVEGKPGAKTKSAYQAYLDAAPDQKPRLLSGPQFAARASLGTRTLTTQLCRHQRPEPTGVP